MVKRKPHDPHRSLRGVVVDNPFYSRAHSGTAGNPKQISAVINTRQSAVTMLYSRGRLDPAQLAAANRFGALWETMGGKGAGAIDYGKEPVDGGQRSDPITERQLMAADELRRARRRLRDPDRYQLVCRICGEGYALDELGRSRRESWPPPMNSGPAWTIFPICGALPPAALIPTSGGQTRKK